MQNLFGIFSPTTTKSRELGGVNVIDLNQNPELDLERRRKCEDNFINMQR